jgi:hypothetical protein
MSGIQFSGPDPGELDDVAGSRSRGWTRQVVPDAANTNYSNDDILTGVAALSSGGAWAVGVSGGLSFVEVWAGVKWTRESCANVGTSNNTFEAVAAGPTNRDVAAVGEYYRATSPYQAQTLVELCRGC